MSKLLLLRSSAIRSFRFWFMSELTCLLLLARSARLVISLSTKYFIKRRANFLLLSFCNHFISLFFLFFYVALGGVFGQQVAFLKSPRRILSNSFASIRSLFQKQYSRVISSVNQKVPRRSHSRRSRRQIRKRTRMYRPGQTRRQTRKRARRSRAD